MKNNSIFKFIIILLSIVLVIFIFSPKVYATEENIAVVNATVGGMISDADEFLTTGDRYENTINVENLKSTSNFIYNVALAVAIVIALVIGTILGVKFITASVEGKAQIKEALIPYIAGCVVVFGSFTIWKIAVNFGQDFSEEPSDITMTGVEQMEEKYGDLALLSDREIEQLLINIIQKGYGNDYDVLLIEMEYYNRGLNSRYNLQDVFNSPYAVEGLEDAAYWSTFEGYTKRIKKIRVFCETDMLRVLSKADLEKMAQYAVDTIENAKVGRYKNVWFKNGDVSKPQPILIAVEESLFAIQKEYFCRYNQSIPNITYKYEYLEFNKKPTSLAELLEIYENDGDLTKVNSTVLKLFYNDGNAGAVREMDSLLYMALGKTCENLLPFLEQYSEQLQVEDISKFLANAYSNVLNVITEENLLELQKENLTLQSYNSTAIAIESEYRDRYLDNVYDLGSAFITPEGYPTTGSKAIEYWKNVKEYAKYFSLRALSQQDLQTMASKAIETINNAKNDPNTNLWFSDENKTEPTPELIMVEEALLEIQGEFYYRLNRVLEEDYNYKYLVCDQVPKSLDEMREIRLTYGNLHRVNYWILSAFWNSKPKDEDIEFADKTIWQAIDEEYTYYRNFHKKYTTGKVTLSLNETYELFKEIGAAPHYLTDEQLIQIQVELIKSEDINDIEFIWAVETAMAYEIEMSVNIFEKYIGTEYFPEYEDLYRYFFKNRGGDLMFEFNDENQQSTTLLYELYKDNSTSNTDEEKKKAAVAVFLFRKYRSEAPSELVKLYTDFINRNLFNESCNELSKLEEYFQNDGHLYKIDDASIIELYNKSKSGLIDLSGDYRLESALNSEYYRTCEPYKRF